VIVSDDRPDRRIGLFCVSHHGERRFVVGSQDARANSEDAIVVVRDVIQQRLQADHGAVDVQRSQACIPAKR
jgi:hypothetical protein